MIMNAEQHNRVIEHAATAIAEAAATAAEQSISDYDREMIEMASELLIMLVRSQRLAEGPEQNR